ncbi:CPBP family intramembrane metalloprotease [Sporolactobacillus sp. THM7-4]|nr:CPBP family intramembrane metalloprotease [Sporolactobacillus sp. THM7-4]
MDKASLDQISDRDMRKTLYLSQGIIIGLSALIVFINPGLLRDFPGWTKMNFPIFLLTCGTSTGIAALQILLDRWIPDQWTDDGGINVRMFQALSYFHIPIAMAVVAVAEEFLFRGLLQPMLGYPAASILFALVHTRYLKKPLLLISALLLGFYLGALFLVFHSLAASILAHYTMNVLLGIVQKHHDEHSRKRL